MKGSNNIHKENQIILQEQSRLQQLAKATMRKNRLRRVIALLSCFVLLLTLNRLKFEADALQRIPACNLCEHVHTASCYQDGELICGLPEHEHTDACYQQRPVQPDPTVFDEFAEINSQVVLASPMDDEDVNISSEFVDETVGEIAMDLDADDSAAAIYAEAGSDDNGLEVEYDLDDLYDENGDETVTADEGNDTETITGDNDAVEKQEYSLNGGSVTFLSEVLRAVGLEVTDINAVGEIVDDAFVEKHIAVEPVEGVDDEYVLKVIESFDRIALGVATADAIETVELTEGVAAVLDEATEASADEETQTSDDEDMVQEVENGVEMETAPAVNDESVTEDSSNDPAAVDGQDDDDTATVDDEQTADEQTADEQTADEQTVDEQTADEQTADEQTVDEQTADETAGDGTTAVVADRMVSLNFTDYKVDDTHTVYLYDADMRAVLVNTAEIGSVDGVVVTTVEVDVPSEEETEADAEEDSPVGVLIIEGDGEYALNDTVYAVTGLVFPEAAGEEVQGEEQSDESNTTVDDQADEAAQTDEVTTAEDQSANDTQNEAAPVEKTVSLDFTDYAATADHTVFLYDASMVAVLVNETEIASTDGVTVTLPEEESGEAPVAEEPAVLIITGDGAYTLNGTTYVVTNLVLPVSVIEGTGADVDVDSDKEITISTSDGEATLPDAVPVFKETEENYDEIFNLFAAAQDEPSLLAKVADVLFGTAYAEEVETRSLQMKLFDIGLKDTDGSSLEPGTEVHVETTFAGIEGEDFRLYHIADGGAELIPDAVVVEDGQAVGLNFNAVSLDRFALVYYTVNVVVEESIITVSVDFTDVVENGVDFDSQDILTALNDGVAIDVASLLARDEESALSVNVEGDDSAEVSGLDIAALEVVSGEGGVEYAEGAIKVSGDGAITLTDGAYTLNIVVANYTGLTKKVLGDGVEISVLDGDVPMGASATYTDLSESADALAEQYGLAPAAEDSAAEAAAEWTAEQSEKISEQDDAEGEPVVGFSAFDVSITTPSGELDADGTFAVTVEHSAEIPAGADCELFHIHNVDGEMVAEKVEDATFGNGTVSFITNGFSEYVIRYTVDFEYTNPETGKKTAWKWPGQGSYKIADIMREIGVTGEIGDVSLERIEDVGGPENALYLSEDKTELISEEAFQDTFELTVVVDGDTYVLLVTDAVTPGYTDLTQVPGIQISFFVDEDHKENHELNMTQTISEFKLGIEYSTDNTMWLASARAAAIEAHTDIMLDYDLSDLIDNEIFIGMTGSGQIYGNDGEAGYFTVNDGHVLIHLYTSMISENATSCDGSVMVHVYIDSSTIYTQRTKRIRIPGQNDELTINWPGQQHAAGQKSVNRNSDSIYPGEDGSEYLEYDYTLTLNGAPDLDKLNLTDYLPAGMTLKDNVVSIRRQYTTREQKSTLVTANNGAYWGDWTDVSSSIAEQTATASPTVVNGKAVVNVLDALHLSAADTESEPVVNGTERTRTVTQSTYTVTYTGRISKADVDAQIGADGKARLTNSATWNEGTGEIPGGETTVTVTREELTPGTKVIDGGDPTTLKVAKSDLITIGDKKYVVVSYSINIREPINASSAVLKDVLSPYQKLHNNGSARLLINGQESGIAVTLNAAGPNADGNGGTITFDLAAALAGEGKTFTKDTDYTLKYDTLVCEENFNRYVSNETDWTINTLPVDGEDKTVYIEKLPYDNGRKWDNLTDYNVYGNGPWEIPWTIQTEQKQTAKNVVLTDKFSDDQTVDPGSFKIWVGDTSYAVPADAGYLHVDNENHTFTIDFDEALKALTSVTDPAFKSYTKYRVTYTSSTTRYDHTSTPAVEKSENQSQWTFDGDNDTWAKDDVVLKKEHFDLGKKTVDTGNNHGVTPTDGNTSHDVTKSFDVDSVTIRDKENNRLKLHYRVRLSEPVGGSDITRALLTDTYDPRETLDVSTMIITVNDRNGTPIDVSGYVAVDEANHQFRIDYVQALNGTGHTFDANTTYYLQYSTYMELNDEIRALLNQKDSSGNVVGFKVINRTHWTLEGKPETVDEDGNQTEVTFKELPYNDSSKSVSVSGSAETYQSSGNTYVCVDSTNNTLIYTIKLRENHAADNVVLHDVLAGSGAQSLNMDSIKVSYVNSSNELKEKYAGDYATRTANGFDLRLSDLLKEKFGSGFKAGREYTITYTVTTTQAEVEGDPGSAAVDFGNGGTWDFDSGTGGVGDTDIHLIIPSYKPGTKTVKVREAAGSSIANKSDWQTLSEPENYSDTSASVSHVVYSATASNPYHLDYTISIKESRQVDTATLTDTFQGSADQTLDVNSFTLCIEGDDTVYTIPASFISATASGFTMNFTGFLDSLNPARAFEKSKRYDIRFTTTTLTCDNTACNGDGADNQAKWNLNDVEVEGGHTETHIRKVTTIQKTYFNAAGDEKGEVDFGEIVKYVVTIGEAGQCLNGMTIRDYMHYSHHILTDDTHSINITAKDAGGNDVTVNLDSSRRPAEWGFHWFVPSHWSPDQMDYAFQLIFPVNSPEKPKIYGPATLVYYALVGTQQQINALGKIPVRNTVYSNEASITTEFKLTSGTVKLEKKPLDISGDTLETNHVEAWWAVELTPVSMSLNNLVLIDYDARYSMVSAQEAADGINTRALYLDHTSIRVYYTNASSDHTAGDPVPTSLYSVDSNGKVHFGDITEPVTVILKTQEKYGYEGGSIYMRNSAKITDSTEQKILDYDTTDKQYEEHGLVSAKKAFSSYEETDDDTIINWVITVDTTDSATVYGYSVKEVINLMRYSTVSPEAAASYDNSYVLDYDYRYGNVVVKQGDTVLEKGVDYEADQNQGVKFIKRLKGPITIEIPSRMGKKLPSGMVYLYNKATLKNRAGGETDIEGTGEIENYKLEVQKKIGNGWYPKKPEEFDTPVNYTVVVNPTKGILPDGKLTLTDVLPAGMEFIDDISSYTYIFVDTSYNHHRITRYENNEEFVKLKPEVTSTTLPDGRVQQTVTVDFSAVEGLTLNKHALTFTYQAKLSQAEQARLRAIGTNEAQIYNNTITFKQGDKVEGSDDVEWSYAWNNGLEKEDITDDVYGNNEHKPYIYYRVTVNPEAREMNGGNEMVLYDTIPTSMELQLNSITVSDRAGNAIDGAKVSYDGITRKLTVRLPDKTTCIVAYMTKIENATLNMVGTFTNTAELYGESVWTDEATEEHRVDTFTGYFHYNVDNGFVIKKVDGNKVSQSLKGAEFTLYKASYSGMSNLEALLNGTYANYLNDRDTRTYDLSPFRLSGNDSSFPPLTQTSKDDGTATFEHLDNFTLYYWKETKTPGDDYSAGEFAKPQYLILYSGSDDGAYNKANLMDKLFEDANGIIVNKAQSGHVWQATNVKFTQHSVSKIWEDNNDAASKRPDRIWVQLYQDDVKYDKADTEENEGLVELKANTLGKWEYTWFDLPATRQGGEEYVYTARELTPDEVYDENRISADERDALKAQMKFYATLYAKITGGTQITNHLKDETTLRVFKDWKDNENSAMKRPISITVRLYRQTMSGAEEGKIVYIKPGNAQNDTIEVSETPIDIVIAAKDDWKAEFTGLVTADGDASYRYYLQELPVTGYTTGYSSVLTGGTAGGEIYGIADSDGVITITNTIEPLSLQVTKQWTNFAIPDGYKVRVYYDLHRYIVSGVTLDKDSTFSYPATAVCYTELTGTGATWSDLPRFSDDGQSEYRYKATEQKVELIPDTWTDAQNEPVADKIDITDLFAVTPGDASLEGSALSQTIVNTVPKTKVEASKVWKNPDGTEWKENLPTSVTFGLYQLKKGETAATEGVVPIERRLDGTADDPAAGQTLKTGELEAWKYTWDDLDAVYWDATARKFEAYTYAVKEASIVYGDSTYDIGAQSEFIVTEGALTGSAESGFTVEITNALNRKDVEFGKQWKNATGTPQPWVPDGAQNAAITVTLTRVRAKSESDSSEYTDDAFTRTFALKVGDEMMTSSDQQVTYALTWTPPTPPSGDVGQEDYIYRFTVKGLEKYYRDGEWQTEWHYRITETTPSIAGKMFNDPAYSVNQTYAGEGEYVINTESADYELPSTGGSGTTVFYILGSTLTLLAAALLIAKRRSKSLQRD